MLLGLFARFLGRTKVRQIKQKTNLRVRLSVESLEDRTVPTVFNAYPGAGTPIQNAINLANNGDTVLVHPGTYTEQLTITKSISLESSSNANGAVHGSHNTVYLNAPATMAPPTVADPGAIIHVTGAGVNAAIEDLVIRATTNSGVQNLWYGIRVDGGAFADIHGNSIQNIVASNDGSKGVGISVGNSGASNDGLGAQIGSASIVDNDVLSYQRAGIVVSNAGSGASISSNKMVGITVHPADSITGVEISDGAVGTVVRNAVSGNSNAQNPAQDGVGVFLFAPGMGTTVMNNSINGNDYGVLGDSIITNSTTVGQGVAIGNNLIFSNAFVGVEIDNSSGVNISNNVIHFNGSDNYQDGGIFLYNSTSNLVFSNTVTVNNGNGIFIDATSTGNTISSNVFQANEYSTSGVTADVVDLTLGAGTAGTANTWANDTIGTQILASGGTITKGKPNKNH